MPTTMAGGVTRLRATYWKGFLHQRRQRGRMRGTGVKRRTIAPAWKGPRTRRPVNIRCFEGRALPSDPDVGVQVTFAPRCAEECLVDVCGQVGLNESERGKRERRRRHVTESVAEALAKTNAKRCWVRDVLHRDTVLVEQSC